MFQIRATSEELFLSTAKVSDVEIVKGFTEQNLRIGFTSSDDTTTSTITTSSNTTTSVGPYAVYGTENSGGSANGLVGYFYPLYLTSDAALAASSTNAIHVHSFEEFPGVSFYMPTEQMNHGKTTFDTSLYTLYTIYIHLKSMEIITVQNVDEVLKVALVKPLKRVEWGEVDQISKKEKNKSKEEVSRPN